MEFSIRRPNQPTIKIRILTQSTSTKQDKATR